MVVRGFLITSNMEKSRLMRGEETRSSLDLCEETRGVVWELFRMERDALQIGRDGTARCGGYL